MKNKDAPYANQSRGPDKEECGAEKSPHGRSGGKAVQVGRNRAGVSKVAAEGQDCAPPHAAESVFIKAFRKQKSEGRH